MHKARWRICSDTVLTLKAFKLQIRGRMYIDRSVRSNKDIKQKSLISLLAWRVGAIPIVVKTQVDAMLRMHWQQFDGKLRS